MLRLSIAIAAALLAVPAATQAASATAGHAQDQAAIEAARELLRAADFEAQVADTARQSAMASFETMIAAAEARQGKPMPADLKERVSRVVMENVDELLAAIKPTALNDAAAIYARYFTVEELRELIRLQDHPVMVKWKRIAPAFTAELMQIGVAALAEHQPAMQARTEAEIAAWEREEALRRSPPRS